MKAAPRYECGRMFFGHAEEKKTDFWKNFGRRGEELDYF